MPCGSHALVASIIALAMPPASAACYCPVLRCCACGCMTNTGLQKSVKAARARACAIQTLCRNLHQVTVVSPRACACVGAVSPIRHRCRFRVSPRARARVLSSSICFYRVIVSNFVYPPPPVSRPFACGYGAVCCWRILSDLMPPARCWRCYNARAWPVPACAASFTG